MRNSTYYIPLSCLLAMLALSFVTGCRGTKKPVQKDTTIPWFAGEVKPSKEKPCFLGAFYRKVVSSTDRWQGIGGTVVLPAIAFDSTRVNPKNPKQFLDNPSIYLGGNMNGQETDIGLSWEVVKDDQGNVSKERLAFRPFLRRTEFAEQEQVFVNAPADKRYYWYPGEEVFMSLSIVEKGVLTFTIEGAGKKFETTFACAGYDVVGVAEFKRVNAIDQMGNEGKLVQPTNTKVEGALWKDTYLLRSTENGISKVPFLMQRAAQMACPEQSHFLLEAAPELHAVGGEKISINGHPYQQDLKKK